MSITALCADRRGDLWCGTPDDGIWRLGASDGQWTHMSPPWGDSGVTSLAQDAAGRMWIGHDSGGLSIYANGQWRHYDMTNSPVGPHVFAIATTHANDVWVASDLALARYSPNSDTWTSFDRASGALPAWPISRLAFDASGNIVAGTPDQGVLLASASDGYSSWRQVTGPDVMPTTPTGAGLPSSVINDVLITRDGTCYAATPYGVAKSDDHGGTWSYLRGADLPVHIDQCYARVGVRPPPRTPAFAATVVTWPRLPLLADWVSRLAQDSSGRVWIGYGGKGYECRSADLLSTSVMRPGVGGPQYVSAFAAAGSASNGGATWLVAGQDGIAGVSTLESTSGPWPTTQPPNSNNSGGATASLPALAATPGVDELNAMRQRVAALPRPDKSTRAEYLGDDWTTGGDWPGRYGRCLVFRSGGPQRKLAVSAAYDIAEVTGPFIPDARVGNGTAPADIRPNANWLYGGRGTRRLGWIDDGTTGNDAYPSTMQGPDLFIGVRVPDGTHRISLYFYTGRDPRDAAAAIGRDYLIEIKKGNDIDSTSQWKVDSSQQLVPIELAQTLARARVNGFADTGVYESFVVHGRGIWWAKIGRNYSDSTRVQAVFVDKLGGDQPTGKWPGLQTNPPASTMPADAAKAADPRAAAAYALWTALDNAEESPGYAAVDWSYRSAAYRAAAAAGAPASWLATWRGALHAWTDEDKAAFRATLALPAAAPRTPQ
jgi:hypothetical protein